MVVLTIQRVKVMLCYGLNPKCEDLLAACIQAVSEFSSKFKIIQKKYTRSEKSQSASSHQVSFCTIVMFFHDLICSQRQV